MEGSGVVPAGATRIGANIEGSAVFAAAQNELVFVACHEKIAYSHTSVL